MVFPRGMGPLSYATLIETETDVLAGLAALRALDPALAPVMAAAGPVPLRLRPGGFAGLAGVIVSQQVSVASARAIWARMEAGLPGVHADSILGATEEALRGCGLSGPKIRALRAVAEAQRAGDLPFEALAALGADQAHALMVKVKGVGPWTADVYLMFCLGHADAFAAGDLALQEAVRIAFGMAARPDPRALLARAEAWRPWRSVAARLLWAYYGAVKRVETVLPGAGG